MAEDVDFAIVGSGFGGSVSALRLVQKGYRVLVLEKGRRFAREDFPKSNWQLHRWLWVPRLGWRGLFKMTFFRHATVLSGVGVGGGSLVYANTLPRPKRAFFAAPGWGTLADWEHELAPHYDTALRMLGATVNPHQTRTDHVMRELARELGKEQEFGPTTVAVYFGEPGVTVPDPYHGGEGPARTGCEYCGGCMLGCRHGAKNTLDQNYLYLAEKRGALVQADSEVEWVRPHADGGYELRVRHDGKGEPRGRRTVRARQVVFAGGVLGTVPLLLALKESPQGLPNLSERVGHFVRTNSEALLGVHSSRADIDFSQGIAISSILHTDEHSHLEPVRYPKGSGFFRLLAAPIGSGANAFTRLLAAAGFMLRHPWRTLRMLGTADFARSTMILLYMRTLEGHLRMTLGRSLHTGFARGLVSEVTGGPTPEANMPAAVDLASRIAAQVDGTPLCMVNELVLNVPTTAHILGGCTMGDSAATGVIDHRHRLFGYEGLYVVDGSAVSANPGVNPSLTITALAERAMSFIEPKRT